MKNLILLLLALPLLSFQNTQTSDGFIGSWKGDDNGEIGIITFEADGYALFEMEGQVIGGREFEMNGEKGKMTYTINSNTSPIQVDFEITKLASGESKKLLAIAEFIDLNTLQIAIGFDSERATEFTESNSIVLKRVK